VTAGRAIFGRDPSSGLGIRVDIEDGRIAAVAAAEVADDAWLAGGLVDLQVNGYAGLDLNDGALRPDTLAALARLLAARGTTTFAPTLITASEATLVAALGAVAEARREHDLVRNMVPFIHVEGPAVSREDGARGAHPLAHVRAPDIDEFRRWQDAAGGLVGLVTLAPEWPGAIEYIEALCRQGVHVALGHTMASPERIHEAAEAGARLSTHLGNGAPAMLPRHPNFIWAQLADDRLTASFIADGHHLPGDTLKAMLGAKTLARAILVSDAAALGGMPPGRYRSAIGGEVDVAESGRLSVAGTPYLAGAGCLLDQNVAGAVNLAGLPLGEALRLASSNPGAFAGGRGRLEPGARADLVRFRFEPGQPALQMLQSFVAGEEVSR
jgi:N-acetylglucosamine-6-phosphate deacetylase